MAARDISGMELSGNYHYIHDTKSYHYIKKTGYLTKSPPEGRLGRWRKRWCMLLDMVRPEAMTGTPSRQVRLEYYTKNPKALNSKEKEISKMKGVIDLRSCIAVVNHDGKIKGHCHVFNIIMPNLSVYHIAASSEEERREWVAAMNDFVFTMPIQHQNYFTKSSNLHESTYLASGAYYDHQSLENLLFGKKETSKKKSKPKPLEFDKVADSSGSSHKGDVAKKTSSGLMSPDYVEMEAGVDLEAEGGSLYRLLMGSYCNLETTSKEYCPIVPQDDVQKSPGRKQSTESYFEFCHLGAPPAASKPTKQDPKEVPANKQFYDSATVYWNDPFPLAQNHHEQVLIQGGPFLRNKRSESTLELSRVPGKTKAFQMKLPHLNHSTLNTRWSLSSTEDTQDEEMADGLVPQIQVFKPASSTKAGEWNRLPTKQTKHPHIGKSSRLILKQSSPEVLGNFLEPANPSIRRTLSNPTLNLVKVSDHLQSGDSIKASSEVSDASYVNSMWPQWSQSLRRGNTWNGKHSAESYYNVAAILAHMDPLGIDLTLKKPLYSNLVSSSEKLKMKSDWSIRTTSPSKVKSTCEQVGTPEASNVGSLRTISQELAEETTELPYCNLEFPENESVFPEQSSNSNLKAEMSTDDDKSEGKVYYNLRSSSLVKRKPESEHSYYNLCRSLPGNTFMSVQVTEAVQKAKSKRKASTPNLLGLTERRPIPLAQSLSIEQKAVSSPRSRNKAPAVSPRPRYNEKGELHRLTPTNHTGRKSDKILLSSPANSKAHYSRKADDRDRPSNWTGEKASRLPSTSQATLELRSTKKEQVSDIPSGEKASRLPSTSQAALELRSTKKEQVSDIPSNWTGEKTSRLPSTSQAALELRSTKKEQVPDMRHIKNKLTKVLSVPLSDAGKTEQRSKPTIAAKPELAKLTKLGSKTTAQSGFEDPRLKPLPNIHLPKKLPVTRRDIRSNSDTLRSIGDEKDSSRRQKTVSKSPSKPLPPPKHKKLLKVAAGNAQGNTAGSARAITAAVTVKDVPMSASIEDNGEYAEIVSNWLSAADDDTHQYEEIEY